MEPDNEKWMNEMDWIDGGTDMTDGVLAASEWMVFYFLPVKVEKHAKPKLGWVKKIGKFENGYTSSDQLG